MAPKPKPRLPPIKVRPSGGITAWHASPHLFDQFDSRHIGTGEGAQAYGHGLYFAGRRPTSEWYYSKFADEHPYYGRPEDEFRLGEGGTVAQRRSFADLTGPEELALDIIESVAEGSAKHQDPVRLKQDAIDELSTRRRIGDEDRKSVHAALIKFLSHGPQWPPRDAHLYKVNIDADPESFLDWNRVASVQSPKVKQALSDLGWFSKGQLLRVLHPQSPDWWSRTGNWLYNNLLEKADRRLSGAVPPRSIEDADRIAKELVATELVASGVPGIRYLDGMSRSGRSRGRATGVRTPPGQNYVMFPGTENLIRIIRRYGLVPPALYAATQGDNNEAQAGMMDFFRKAASGQPMSRREFLRGAGGAAAAAAAARVPVPSGAGVSAPALPAMLDPRAILPPAFDAGFALPNTGENIVMLNGDAVLWGGDYNGRMTREEMLANKAILERARAAMPPSTDRPMMFNHLTGQWHEEALRDPVPPGGDPDTWQRVFLKAGERAPDNHNLLLTEQYLPEDFAGSAYDGGTLTSPPGWAQAGKKLKAPKAYRGEPPKTLEAPRDAVDGYEQEWWRERRGLLDWERRQSDGTNAKELAQSDDGRRLLQESNIAPGGRYEGQVPALTPEANAMGSNMGLPGDEPTERTGRIRRLLQMGVPLAAATGVSTIAQARTPQEEQAARMDFLREAMPPQDFEGRKHRIAALRESGEIPQPPPPDPFASERERRRQERSYELQAQGMQRDVAELRATKEMELHRPTISARFVHEHINPAHDPNGPPVSPAALMFEESRARADLHFFQNPEAEPVSPQRIFEYAVQKLVGSPPSQGPYGDMVDSELAVAGEVIGGTLQALNAHAPQGEYSDRSGIPQAEFDQLQGQYGDNANFMYPNRLQKNFDALRQFELFSAGTEADERETPGGKVLRSVADVMSVRPGVTAANTMSPGIGAGAWAWGAAPDAQGRVIAQVGDEVGRARDALDWYRRSSPKPGEYQSYRDLDTNDAFFQRFSTTTPSGLSKSMTDADRRLGRWSLPTLAWTQDPTVDAKDFLSQARIANNRPVNIVPEGLTPEQSVEFGKKAAEYGQKSDDWLGAKYAANVGDYPTGFQNTFLNLGRQAGDVMTWPTLFFGGLLGAAKGAAQGSVIQALKGAGLTLGGEIFDEALENSVFDAGLQGVFGGSIKDYVSKPLEGNSLASRPDGSTVAPSDRRFGETVDRNMSDAIKGVEFDAARWRELTRPKKSPLDRR